MGSEFRKVSAQVKQLETALGRPKDPQQQGVSVLEFLGQLDAKLYDKLKANHAARSLLSIREGARVLLSERPARDPVMPRAKLDFVLNSEDTIKELEDLFGEYDMARSSASLLMASELRELGEMTSCIADEISGLTSDLRGMLAATSAAAVVATDDATTAEATTATRVTGPG